MHRELKPLLSCNQSMIMYCQDFCLEKLLTIFNNKTSIPTLLTGWRQVFINKW
jgi:hypothetical protein